MSPDIHSQACSAAALSPDLLGQQAQLWVCSCFACFPQRPFDRCSSAFCWSIHVWIHCVVCTDSWIQGGVRDLTRIA